MSWEANDGGSCFFYSVELKSCLTFNATMQGSSRQSDRITRNYTAHGGHTRGYDHETKGKRLTDLLIDLVPGLMEAKDL